MIFVLNDIFVIFLITNAIKLYDNNS